MLKFKEYLCNVSYIPLYQSLKMMFCKEIGKVLEKLSRFSFNYFHKITLQNQKPTTFFTIYTIENSRIIFFILSGNNSYTFPSKLPWHLSDNYLMELRSGDSVNSSEIQGLLYTLI